MNNIKVGDKVRVKKNERYFEDSLKVGDIGEVSNIDEEGDIHFVSNGFLQVVNAKEVDTYLELIPEPIDFTKAQVFDPPVLLEVSDYPGFPKANTAKVLVYVIYPMFKYPIRSIDDRSSTEYSVWKYAREIKKDAFEEFWGDNGKIYNGVLDLKAYSKEVWEAGVKHGKENK